MATQDLATLKARYEKADQGHLFHFWDQLNTQEQSQLLGQLSSIDVERVNRVWANAMQGEKDASSESINDGSDEITPLPSNAFDTIVGSGAKEAEWREVGLNSIAEGRVGVLLMAGGQGTRLGSSDPKGCYDIGLPSHKSLFQYQAERIARLQAVAEEEQHKSQGSVIIPWYIMTSGPTRKPTVAFFEKNRYFGLDPKNVIFFEQGR